MVVLLLRRAAVAAVMSLGRSQRHVLDKGKRATATDGALPENA
jgi:hypothetical protein